MAKRGLVICSLANVLLFLVGCGLICAGLVVWLSVFPDKFVDELKKNKILGLNDDGSKNDYTRGWLDGTDGIRQNYYFYDYTNYYGIVDRGAKPDVYEKGPYVYNKVYTYAESYFINDTRDFVYNYTTTYVFDPIRSCPTCKPNDTFTTPDPVFQLMMGIFSSKSKVCQLLSAAMGVGSIDMCHLLEQGGMPPLFSIPADLQPIVDYITNHLPSLVGLGTLGFDHKAPFVEVSVEDLLYKGYNDPLIGSVLKGFIKIVNEIVDNVKLPLPLPHINVNFSQVPSIHLFTNNSNDYKYTLLTGKLNYKEVGEMVGFTNLDGSIATTRDNGVTYLPENWWNVSNADYESCPEDLKRLASQLNGTSGQFFHVKLDKKSQPYVYVEDICRSLKFVYDSETTVRDVDGYRFVIDSDTFNYNVPSNCGFCTKLNANFYDRLEGEFCLPNGLLHLGGCKSPTNININIPGMEQLGGLLAAEIIKIPVVASNPHFFGADQQVIDLFPRFKPTKEKDMTTLDIEPQTGTLLQAHKRMQLNVLVRQFPNISSFSSILPGAYPMFWVDETYTIDDSSLKSLQGVLGMKNTIKLVCYIVGVGLGSLLVVISLVSCFANICCVNRPEEHNRVQPESKFEDYRLSPARREGSGELRARTNVGSGGDKSQY
ncbi:hypothetical protein L596_014503 [Steinernema carpocapsae]|uniref:CD36 family protein n=1 Tax=Steinernema carpocapsae TaxID=34508 RepID=A0A4U5NC48_STECR|nr:hypothetical protein L596_014503 [Steinernema carpocapsae]